ncbi:oligopeptide transporter 2 [Xylariomycetidae sp. FL2044]|nr:oligopeptide transporter 2 [Xylariomycetidae sp. FL2044]
MENHEKSRAHDLETISSALPRETPSVIGDTGADDHEEKEEVEGKPEIGQVVEAMKDEGQPMMQEQRQRVAMRYGWQAEGDRSASSSSDVEYILDRVASMGETEAVDILVDAISQHADDPNFPAGSLAHMRRLVAGPKAYQRADSKDVEPDTGAAAAAGTAVTEEDYLFDLKTEAAIYHNHSPYPEMRSVTRPEDDPETPVETNRGLFPGPPAIGISHIVMQLLIAPCGLFLARVLPDWGITVAGTRHSLNPGPWNFKEQVFSSVIFGITNNAANTYYVYLVQRLPQYLGNTWVTFGYEIVLALSVNFFSMGFAGLLRRFVLPALALNRALIERERRAESVNGWTVSRYGFFLGCAVLMFFYFWIPNSLFKTLRSFNWMTWIAPQNFTLAMVTGLWGGMGFNPWATFDWNVAGTGALTTPSFSTAQQYGARVVSGLIIIRMYWGNMYWSAYMPINSNEVFANDGTKYNVTRILNQESNGIDVDAYREYGPPFFSGANVFGQGGWFAWYPLTLFSVTMKHWEAFRRAGLEMYRGVRHRRSIYGSYGDPFAWLMRAYPEVPDWWFLAVLTVCPVHVPWWSLLAIMGVSAVMLVPATLLRASANVQMGFHVLFQLLGGLWFPGSPEALIIVTAYGQNFDGQASDYVTGQKMGHYAKIPPRAVFRGQTLAVLINTFVFVGMLDWMVTNFDDGTLCQWNNAQHFVCTNAVLVYASAIEYGAFGVRNMFELYPILAWCLLLGVVWGLVRRYGTFIHGWVRRRASEGRLALYERYLFKPLSYLRRIDPAVTLSGALNWTGGNNLSYATNAMYISFIMMYHVKRHYGAWWEKYNYLIEAGFGVGVALSAIIQTFAFAFTNTDFPSWWGNGVTTAGIDYVAYNQNATLLPVPPQGFFGPPPSKYPMNF